MFFTGLDQGQMTNNKANWQRMQFKNNKVWVALDQNGQPAVKNGKVLIKYQLDQDHEYWVHLKNVQPIQTEQTRAAARSPRKPAAESIQKKVASELEHIDESLCEGAVCMYTDGASSGNPGPSGIGVVLQFGEHRKEISRNIGMATNNIAELEAIRTGLLELKNFDIPIRVFTDSSYAYGLLELGWKARKNTELIASIKKTISKFKDLKIIKVKGHAGIAENERADALATSAIKK